MPDSAVSPGASHTLLPSLCSRHARLFIWPVPPAQRYGGSPARSTPGFVACLPFLAIYDPGGSISVHGLGAIWGLVAAGISAAAPPGSTVGTNRRDYGPVWVRLSAGPGISPGAEPLLPPSGSLPRANGRASTRTNWPPAPTPNLSIRGEEFLQGRVTKISIETIKFFDWPRCRTEPYNQQKAGLLRTKPSSVQRR
jgi:hypothetical protein